MAMRRAFIKVADPREGISREEYEKLCAELGVAPVYENATAAPAGSAEDEPEPTV
jgi:hypothetical protein